MKKARQALSLFSLLFYLFSLFFPSSCFLQQEDPSYNDEEDFEVEVRKDLDDPEYIAITNYIGQRKNVNIPPRIQDRPVISIGPEAFREKGLTSVIIPEEVRTISSAAFAHNRLTSVTIPDSVSAIYESAFAHNRLTSVTIPDSVLYINKSAFAENQLTRINMSAKVAINDAAFDDIGFIKFYMENGSRAGTYTVSNGLWSGTFAQETVIGPDIDGTYKIVSAYANLYDRYPMYEIPTRNLGTRIIINNDEASFGNSEYQLYDAEVGSQYGKYSIITYEQFIEMYAGINYGEFDRNIIGADYDGMVMVKNMRNGRNNYMLFFADNKLIVDISLFDIWVELETEFILLAISYHDHFFYIAERVTE
jgi:hypothetical protein